MGGGKEGGGKPTFAMAEFKVGLGAVLFAPKSRFIVTVGLQGRET